MATTILLIPKLTSLYKWCPDIGTPSFFWLCIRVFITYLLVRLERGSLEVKQWRAAGAKALRENPRSCCRPFCDALIPLMVFCSFVSTVLRCSYPPKGLPFACFDGFAMLLSPEGSSVRLLRRFCDALIPRRVFRSLASTVLSCS
jgi:hypothetical protein